MTLLFILPSKGEELMLNVELIKKNLRISHDLEDELLEIYLEWAKATVLDSVTTADNIDMDYVESNMQFIKASVMLTSHYYENRLAISEIKYADTPYGVLHAIQALRGNPKIHMEVDD